MRTKGGILSANADNKHVEGNLGGRNISLDLRVIIDVDHLLLIINFRSLSLVVFHSSLFVSQEVADRLHDRAVLDRSSGT